MESLCDMRNGSLVERTRTRLLRWISINLKLDGTEDDEVDEDHEVAQDTLLILVAQDVKHLNLQGGWLALILWAPPKLGMGSFLEPTF